jgi:hypothetical protein
LSYTIFQHPLLGVNYKVYALTPTNAILTTGDSHATTTTAAAAATFNNDRVQLLHDMHAMTLDDLESTFPLRIPWMVIIVIASSFICHPLSLLHLHILAPASRMT